MYSFSTHIPGSHQKKNICSLMSVTWSSTVYLYILWKHLEQIPIVILKHILFYLFLQKCIFPLLSTYSHEYLQKWNTKLLMMSLIPEVKCFQESYSFIYLQLFPSSSSMSVNLSHPLSAIFLPANIPHNVVTNLSFSHLSALAEKVEQVTTFPLLQCSIKILII